MSKKAQNPQFLTLLTWKCASCHSSVHFFDIATSKSGPSMVCFVHFDLEMCFAPQRRALFRHRNFQKWSEQGVCVLCILTSKCASRHNGVHFLDISTSKSARRPPVFNTFYFQMCFAQQRRTLFRHRNFQKWSDPLVFCTFWLGNALCATTVFRDVPTFSRTCVFFLLIFSLLTLLTSAFQLSILSEVSLLNFLRTHIYDILIYFVEAWSRHADFPERCPMCFLQVWYWGGEEIWCIQGRRALRVATDSLYSPGVLAMSGFRRLVSVVQAFKAPHPLRCPSIEASWYGPMAGKGPNALKLEALQADDLSRPLVLCIRFCVADDPEVSSWERILSRFLFLLGKKICTFDLCRYWVGFLHWPQQDWYVKLFGTDSESPESESNDASDETGDTSSEDREKSLFQCLPDHWVKFVTPMVCWIMLNPKTVWLVGPRPFWTLGPCFDRFQPWWYMVKKTAS